MYLRDVLISCWRRWPLFLVCLAVSGVLMNQAADRIRPSYESVAHVLLVPPVSTQDPEVNRYLGLGGLTQSVEVLVSSMSSEETTQQLENRVPGATFDIESDVTTSAPILNVRTMASTPASAKGLLDAVLTQIPISLARLQDTVEVKPRNQITQVVLSRDRTPDVVQKTRYRLLGVFAGLLMLASALVVAATDGILVRRARQRDPAPDAGQDDVPDAGNPGRPEPEPEPVAEEPSETGEEVSATLARLGPVRRTS